MNEEFELLYMEENPEKFIYLDFLNDSEKDCINFAINVNDGILRRNIVDNTLKYVKKKKKG